MALIKWKPFFAESFEGLEDFFEGFSGLEAGWPKMNVFTPAVDVYQTKEAVIVEVPLAGVEAEDAEVSIEDNVLTLKGESKKKSEVEEKDYYRKEVRSGSFYRQISLPAPVMGEKAQALSINGVIRVTIPKAEETKSKAVKVKVVKVSSEAKKK